MATDPTTWRLTIRHPDGQPLFSVLIEREPGNGNQVSPNPSAPAPAKRQAPAAPAGASDGEPRMTEPQRRYLFRLLAAQGIEGKRAEDHLKQYFGVRGLREVSKTNASQLIDQMVTDRKEAGDGRA